MSSDIEINDIRAQQAFKSITFSKFKRSDVRKELLNSLIHAKIESACYWSAELVCAGHYSDIWEIVILFYSKYVHIGNPKIAIYLELRVNQFKDVISNGYGGEEIKLRNNPKIRRLFCEIMCVLCDAKRKHSFDTIKINKQDFNLTNMSSRFNAPNVTFIDGVFREDDPKELFVAINELAFCLSNEGNNIIDACYWIEWIIEYETICKQKKEKCFCEKRTYIQVETKLQGDIIWLVWDVFKKESESRNNPFIIKVIKSLLTLFTLKYTIGCNRKRKYLMYFIVSLLCEPISNDEEIIREKQKDIVANIISKIDMVYKQIKKNEESPGTDYMFKDLSSNLDKTIEKLEKMNTFGSTFVPRINN
jgi:hypothetical protein